MAVKTSKERKHVHWRIGEQIEKDKLNGWIDAQANLQASLTSLVLHMIDRFGNRNITDHDIQRLLYLEHQQSYEKDDAPQVEDPNVQINVSEEQKEQSEVYPTKKHEDNSMSEFGLTSSDF